MWALVYNWLAAGLQTEYESLSLVLLPMMASSAITTPIDFNTFVSRAEYFRPLPEIMDTQADILECYYQVWNNEISLVLLCCFSLR